MVCLGFLNINLSSVNTVFYIFLLSFIFLSIFIGISYLIGVGGNIVFDVDQVCDYLSSFDVNFLKFLNNRYHPLTYYKCICNSFGF